MSTTDTIRAAYEAWINTDEAMGSTSITWDTWKAALTWQAATEATKATGAAGELPPLPDFPAHARLYTTGLGRRTYRRAATTPGEGAPLVLVSEAKAIAREYGHACAEAREAYLMQSHAPLMDAASAKYRIEKAEAARQPAPVLTEDQKLRLRTCIEAGVAFGIVARGDADAILAATNRSQP